MKNVKFKIVNNVVQWGNPENENEAVGDSFSLLPVDCNLAQNKIGT